MDIAADDQGQNACEREDRKDMRRLKGHTNLPRPFKLDDLVSILIDVDLFLCVVAPVLDDDEQ